MTSHPLAGASVLVLCDDPERRRALLTAFVRADAVTQVADSARTARSMLDACRADVVVTAMRSEPGSDRLLGRAADLHVPVLQVVEPGARTTVPAAAADWVRVLPRRLSVTGIVDAAAGWLQERRSARRRPRTPSGVPDLTGFEALVVAADATLQRLLAATLGACGARVAVAGSAESAATMLAAHRPDAVLFDARTPDPTSAIALGARRRGVTAIAVTLVEEGDARLGMLVQRFGVRVLATTDIRAIADVLESVSLGRSA